MPYHYTESQPDEALINSISFVNGIELDAFASLAKTLYLFLTMPGESTALLAKLETLASEKKIAFGAVKQVVRAILNMLRGALRKNLTPKQVFEDFIQLGLAQERAEGMGKLWKANLGAMSRVVLAQTLSVNRLVDMEWKFGVSTGTDRQRRLGNAFLQLKIVLDKGNSLENVYLEMTLQQFYEFLKDMEQARSSLEYYS